MVYIKKHKVLSILFLLVILILLLVIIFEVYRYSSRSRVVRELSKMDLDGVNKLVIVAHPDDEILWGGAGLIQDDYLVVCVTCGSDKERVKEIENGMKATGDSLIMLNYPDKIFDRRSNWTFDKKFIKRDIEAIVNYKDWDFIVTHNSLGEYGHQHHIMTHDIVFSVVDNQENLYVFNYYCSLNSMNTDKCVLDLDNKLSDEIVKEKEDILYTYYKSQKNTIDKLGHMIPYESFIKE